MSNCNCFICMNQRDVIIPEEIINACEYRDLVIFAGAGVSTEGKGNVFNSFYDSVLDELNIDSSDLSFSDLMEKLCDTRNGRSKLIQLFVNRLRFIESYEEVLRQVTKFHNELSTVFGIREIVTTNWDTYFEDYCGCTPFVQSEDFALASSCNRNVYKIHGSISNFGSIVATSSDYKNCYKRLHEGLIGSKLKLLLGSNTKVVVFVGYSLEDDDFKRILQFLNKELGEFMPHFYVVSLDDKMREKFDSKKFTVLNTDATFFIHLLKQKLFERNIQTNDVLYNHASAKYEMISDAHKVLSKKSLINNPEYLYCLYYQDGILHAYQRIMSLKKTGYSSIKKNICIEIKDLEALKISATEQYNYGTVAYIDGYINALKSLQNIESLQLPSLYYLFDETKDSLIQNFEEKIRDYYEKNIDKYNKAIEVISNKDNVVSHHVPFL